MRKLILSLILFASCQTHQEPQTACLSPPSDSLIASNELMLIARVDTPLTKEDLDRLDRQYPQTLKKIYKNEPLQTNDIIHLTRSGVADSSIIEIIDSRGSRFYLTPKDKQELFHAGISNRVIASMEKTTDLTY